MELLPLQWRQAAFTPPTFTSAHVLSVFMGVFTVLTRHSTRCLGAPRVQGSRGCVDS